MNQSLGTSFDGSPFQARPADDLAATWASIGRRRGIARELWWFLGLTFVSTWGLAAYASAHGGLKTGALPLAMLLPMTAAFVVQRFIAKRPMFRGSELGIRWGRPRYWILAPAAVLVFWFEAFLVNIGLHPSLLATMPQIAAAVRGLKNVPGSEASLSGKLVVAYVMTALVAPVLNLPIFLGEEIGWRGFMTPRLVALFGRRGLFVAGAIWAAWHVPFIAMGLNYPTHPVWGQVVWFAFCIEFGIVLQMIVLRSGSVVPAALVHGITNQVTMLTISVFFVEQRFIDLVDIPAGLISVVLLAIPAIYCYRKFPDLRDPVLVPGPSEIDNSVGVR